MQTMQIMQNMRRYTVYAEYSEYAKYWLVQDTLNMQAIQKCKICKQNLTIPTQPNLPNQAWPTMPKA